jgi:hypothetical protein
MRFPQKRETEREGTQPANNTYTDAENEVREDEKIQRFK